MCPLRFEERRLRNEPLPPLAGQDSPASAYDVG